MHHIRTGVGKPLLLVHGLGGSWRSWQTILHPLTAEREVIAIDLPGHGRISKAGNSRARALMMSSHGGHRVRAAEWVDELG